MKKIGIITLNGNGNYGNRLQNYALQTFLSNYIKVETIWITNGKKVKLKQYVKKMLGMVIKKYRRSKKFVDFTNKFIRPKYYSKYEDVRDKYSKFVVGSDQVWNCTFNGFTDNYFLSFSDNRDNNISYSASFGIETIPNEYINTVKKGINNIKYLSVREEAGKKIVYDLTSRTDVEVLIDPTMLLTAEKWIEISKKPKKLKYKKYILCYFLGELSNSRREEIERIANENNCEVIYLLDKEDPFYSSGPLEFLYLENNAFLICTDSFHSTVFAILFNKPFIIFEREEKNMGNMNSRIDTLLKTFELKNKKFNGKRITKENLEHDYTEAYNILKNQRKKSEDFLAKSLKIKDSD